MALWVDVTDSFLIRIWHGDTSWNLDVLAQEIHGDDALVFGSRVSQGTKKVLEAIGHLLGWWNNTHYQNYWDSSVWV